MTPRERAEKIAILIGREVAELPDRTSPPDEPTLLLVTEQELREILEPHLERAITDHLASLAAEDVEAMADELAEIWMAHVENEWPEIARHVLALQAAAVAKAVDEFTASILHGDDKHQAWLKDKAAEYIRALDAPAQGSGG